jgi:uncharacterized membrane protein
MRSNTKKVRKVLVKAVVLGCLVSASVALANGSGSSTTPGGGYAEPIILQPTSLGDGIGGGGNGYPMHISIF